MHEQETTIERHFEPSGHICKTWKDYKNDGFALMDDLIWCGHKVKTWIRSAVLSVISITEVDKSQIIHRCAVIIN